jgi:oxalate---CoA ligase
VNATSTQGLAVTLPELLNSLATKFPDKLALAAPGRTGLSYRALAAHIDCAQAAMRECGLGHGDRIALVLPNGPEMAAAFLAVAGGAVCAPLNPPLPRRGIRFLPVRLGGQSTDRRGWQ